MLIQSEFYLLAAVTKSCQCTEQHVQKIVVNSLPHAPSRVRRSEKNSSGSEGGKLPKRNRIRKRRKQ